MIVYFEMKVMEFNKLLYRQVDNGATTCERVINMSSINIAKDTCITWQINSLGNDNLRFSRDKKKIIIYIKETSVFIEYKFVFFLYYVFVFKFVYIVVFKEISVC